MPTYFSPSWEGGRNYQAGSITGKKIEDSKDALEKTIHINGTMIVCEEDNKFKKRIIKSSPFDGGKQRHIELGLQSVLPRRKIEDGKDASKKHIDAAKIVYQSNDKEFQKGIVNGSSFDGSETNYTASPVGREDINLRFKVASRDLKSFSLLGKGLSGIVYETIWKEELRCARKDFVHVPSDLFEREAEVLVRLEGHSNVVQVIGWTVAKICCSLALELMDCSLRSLAQRRMLLRRVTNSEPLVDSTSTSDSGCSNSPELPLTPKQEDEKKTNDSNYPFSVLEVVQIMTAIAAGMKHLHDNEVAHGDLKPGNILVTLKKRAGNSNAFDDSLAIETVESAVKVVDFGVIKSKSKSRCMVSVSSATRELDRVRRKAPELLPSIKHDSEPQKFKTLAMGDIYSFGMTASEILSGEEPYSDYQNSGVKTLQEAIKGGTRPQLPDRSCPQLNALIKRCWAHEPTKRPSDFGCIFEELEKTRVALSPGKSSLVPLGSGSSKKLSSWMFHLPSITTFLNHTLMNAHCWIVEGKSIRWPMMPWLKKNIAVGHTVLGDPGC